MKTTPTNRQSQPPKSWLITGLMGAAAVAYVLFVFVPMRRSIEGVRQQIEERRQEIMEAHNLTATLAESKLQLAAARIVSHDWRSHAPRQAQLISHYASLTQQAHEAGVAIDRLDPLPATELNLLTRQNVAMQFHAPFAAVFDLVRRLESLPGTLWIRDLRLHASDDSSATLRGELTLTIFADRADYAN